MTQDDAESRSTKSSSAVADGERTERLLAAYGEVCRSYHAIDDFRTKLLGVLPIASLAGILVVGKDTPLAEMKVHPLIGFGSFFAAAFTLSLFLFEIRGILRCSHLIERGEALERKLRVEGQFYVCSQQHARATGHEHAMATEARSERFFNAKVAACAVYSLVFAAWLFMALKFSFGWAPIGCGLTATVIGGLLAFGVHEVVSERIAA